MTELLQMLEKFNDIHAVGLAPDDSRSATVVEHVKRYIHFYIACYNTKPQFKVQMRAALTFTMSSSKGTFTQNVDKAALVKGATIQFIDYEESVAGEYKLLGALRNGEKAEFVCPCRGFLMSNYLTEYGEEDERYPDLANEIELMISKGNVEKLLV